VGFINDMSASTTAITAVAVTVVNNYVFISNTHLYTKINPA